MEDKTRMRHKVALVGVLAFSLAACQTSKEDKLAIALAEQQQEDAQAALEPKIDSLKAGQYNLQLAIGYLEQGNIKRAKSKLNRAVELSPDLPETHYTYGYFYEQTGETLKALNAYEHAVSLNPTLGQSRNNYGAFLCRQKQYRKAEENFLLAVRDPQYTATAEAYENAALCVSSIPDTKKAEYYFTKALQHNPRSARALLSLADISIEKEEFTRAKGFLRQYDMYADSTPESVALQIQVEDHFGNQDAVASLKLLLKNRFRQEG